MISSHKGACENENRVVDGIRGNSIKKKKKKKSFALVTKLFFIIRNRRLNLEAMIIWQGSVRWGRKERNFYCCLFFCQKLNATRPSLSKRELAAKIWHEFGKRIVATAKGAGAGPSRPHQLQHTMNKISKRLMKTRPSLAHLHAPSERLPALPSLQPLGSIIKSWPFCSSWIFFFLHEFVLIKIS